ncbi:carboxymuconolactone decarboxylase [Actinoplanes awajinensis subsp. mycoplanecinus]|uniref:Carboxymuconolactone decarboxylase n=1 Tax=Actinoplanes awajinensis subsp. mycoplanecinus TaxID=135947 RepID=A0A101JL93_9ACTN|nr:carboxymuconolactone decarboxylase [Actinoplanes awajinensis subsp. mycoplanecinus]
MRKLLPGELTSEQRAVYDAIAGGPRAAGSAFPLVDADGGLEGPFNAMLLQPGVGGALQELGSAVRYRTGLTTRAREIAILTVARVWRSDFERYAHEAVARAAGFSEAELSALRTGDVAAFPDPGDRLILDVGTALAERRDLTDEEFTAARDGLGLPALFELTTLAGYYATLALQLRVFRVVTPESLDSAAATTEDFS